MGVLHLQPGVAREIGHCRGKMLRLVAKTREHAAGYRAAPGMDQQVCIALRGQIGAECEPGAVGHGRVENMPHGDNICAARPARQNHVARGVLYAVVEPHLGSGGAGLIQ